MTDAAATPTIAATATQAEIAAAQAVVCGLYRGFLAREPDPAGLAYWTQQYMASGDANQIMQALLQSDEYRQARERTARYADVTAAFSDYAKPLLAQRALTVVDVGAQELAGEQHIWTPLPSAQLPCQIVGFEPQTDKPNRHPQITLLPDFIGDGKPQRFYLNNDDATSSLLPLNTDLISGFADLTLLNTVHSEPVATRTLDDVLHDYPRIDFLKLDIQGFEYPALTHANAVLARTNVVHCEVSFMPIYQGQVLFSEVEELMREHGFYLLDFHTLCRYPWRGALNDFSNNRLRDRLGWGDAVFFKQPEKLNDALDLLAQSVIALLIYQKYSLAEALARQYAASAGDSAAAQFFNPQGVL